MRIARYSLAVKTVKILLGSYSRSVNHVCFAVPPRLPHKIRRLVPTPPRQSSCSIEGTL